MQPMIRGTNLRVKTLVVAHKYWELSAEEIADRWPVKVEAVRDALAFYEVYTDVIDQAIAEEKALTAQYANETVPAS